MISNVSTELFRPVTTRSAVDDAVDQVLDRLREGTINEGDILPSERALAPALDVSRRTVRAATKVLVDLGLVEVIPGPAGGVKVISIWVPNMRGPTPQELQPDEIFSALEARRTLEPRLAQLAGVRGTDAHFAAMRRTIDLQWEHRGEQDKVGQMDTRFHRLMWRAAGNETLEAAIKVIHRRLAIATDAMVDIPIDTEASIELHEQTLAALTRGDPDGIAKATDQHLTFLEHICESALGRRRIREEPAFLRSSATQS